MTAARPPSACNRRGGGPAGTTCWMGFRWRRAGVRSISAGEARRLPCADFRAATNPHSLDAERDGRNSACSTNSWKLRTRTVFALRPNSARSHVQVADFSDLPVRGGCIGLDGPLIGLSRFLGGGPSQGKR